MEVPDVPTSDLKLGIEENCECHFLNIKFFFKRPADYLPLLFLGMAKNTLIQGTDILGSLKKMVRLIGGLRKLLYMSTPFQKLRSPPGVDILVFHFFKIFHNAGQIASQTV